MNDNAVLNLIKNTFENSFDRERFLIFAKNLFHFLDTDSFIYRGNLIPDAYDSHIKTLERLGKYEDVDGHKIEVLAVQLNKQSALERARTLQRNFIAWYLNGSRGGITKDAALVAFYTKDSDDWRLSLVKMDYHLGESKAGKIKAITELTPARRFSFLVGANENTHTAQRQLLPILKDTDFKPALSDLESAFSVEVVTKDFFEKYKKLFLDTKEALDAMVAKDDKIKADFQEKNIDTTDFAKKLLGQIVFLYFLQKKGWFGVARDDVWGTGPKDFLRRLFERQLTEYDNFFNNILEPLFYEALAVERTDDFYSKFNCKIPFLNGGLFDPLGNYDWVHTDIRLPDDLFSNTRKTKEGDTGDGILDVFDRYNFTVKEDEPLEREVAVDPEMLGKVFENLLEVKDRKSKGTYYTPREIVHYMCQESLINYLLTELDGKVKRDDIETLIRLGETAIENEALVMDKGFETKDHHFKLPQSIRDNATLLDEKLEKIHVCDPAVGSGAFLVGMMTEVIRVRNILTRYLADNDRSIYNFKRHAIQNCLYGVDIDPGAVEIAKLRLWLSLIVDEQDIKQIKPLPNLDYKIMQGNSLLEEYEGIKLFDEGIVSASPLDNTKQIEEINQKLSDLQREFFKLHSAGELKGIKKQQIEAELKKYSDWLSKLTKAPKVKADNGSLFDQFSQAKLKSDELKKLHQEFFETANKREKDEIKKKIEVLEWELIEATLREKNKLSLLPEIERFKKANIKPFFLWKLNFSDVFEKNGERGFDVVLANPPYIGEKGNKEIFRPLAISGLGERFYKRKMDIFYFFFHLGLDLLKARGFLGFITTNYYVTADQAVRLRLDFKNRAVVKRLINFNELRIFDSAQGQHNMMTMLIKDGDLKDNAENCITQRNGLAKNIEIKSIIDWNDDRSRYYSVKQDDLYEGDDAEIRLQGIDSASSKNNSILSKIKLGGEPLQNFCTIFGGVETGSDKVTKSLLNNSLEKGNLRKPELDNFTLGEGIYILSRYELENLHLNPDEEILIKKWYKSSDIFPFGYHQNKPEYLIYVDSKVNIADYPNIEKHLRRFRPLLISREQANDESHNWFWIRGSKRQFFSNGEYLVCPYRNRLNAFAYSNGDFYSSRDVYYLIVKDNDEIHYKYLLALLNSKLIFFWLYHKGKRKGETLELYQKPLSEIPIKVISKSEQTHFIDAVDEMLLIIKAQQNEPNQLVPKWKNLKSKCDQLVYKLYGLTPAEIEVVEDITKRE